MKKASEGYMEVKTFPHYGELAVPHKGRRTNSDGEVEREFVMLDCIHDCHIVWLKRTDFAANEALPF